MRFVELHVPANLVVRVGVEAATDGEASEAAAAGLRAALEKLGDGAVLTGRWPEAAPGTGRAAVQAFALVAEPEVLAVREA